MAASFGGLLTLSACGQTGPLMLPKRPPKPPDAVAPAPAASTPAASTPAAPTPADTTRDGKKNDAMKP
ncbi:MAG: lipoprotein [Burkholderiaceae bacterium]